MAFDLSKFLIYYKNIGREALMNDSVEPLSALKLTNIALNNEYIFCKNLLEHIDFRMDYIIKKIDYNSSTKEFKIIIIGHRYTRISYNSHNCGNYNKWETYHNNKEIMISIDRFSYNDSIYKLSSIYTE